jgi:uncharacterized RDD family membrane protein YckC
VAPERRDDDPRLTSGDPLWSGSLDDGGRSEAPTERGPEAPTRHGPEAPTSRGPEAPERPGPSPAYGDGPVPPGAGGGGAVAAPGMPPGPTGRFTLAEWWRRVVAMLVDGLLIGVLAIVLIVVVTGAIGGVGFVGGDETGVVAIILGLMFSILMVAVIALLYAPLYMTMTNGQTLGRQAVGIRVVRTNGERTDFWWSVLREVVVKQLLFAGVGWSLTGGIAWLLDGLWPLWDDESRALHDMMVSSRVVKT